ncbi:CAF17-like 4Fe-4S cluster assembly/insertion protein YgfZ [Marinobacterium rhizophilum]|uniref:Folate-binding protein YgfZ n=1 Tax=Marinobacterium rhizophilum TaxID=420402 RepID=A0ABY5HJK8_9GAMM|nr:folate-binding protein [Marinobacterium rhizophilum]UTW11763.1 folate-binding protein YgfZ [Marinobacterium rhizophilum]
MSEWLDKISALGATLNDSGDRIVHVSDRESETRLTPLLHQGIFSVQGPDAEKFLQGQLSCDMKDVSTLGSRLGAHCNIKGHMHSLLRVMRIQDGFWLRGQRELLPGAQALLKKYMLFSKAQSTDLGDDIVGLGCSGPGAAVLVEKVLGQVPSEVDGIYASEGILAVRVPGKRFEIWLPRDQALALLPELIEFAPLGTTDAWELAEIRAAIPDLRSETVEGFIPQMTNLQALHGVSFTKGCYTGQEIVTRLQHRGQLKRPMYRATVNSDNRPAPGTALYSADKDNVGKVVLAAPSGEGQFELLAVIVKELAETTPILLGNQGGPALTLQELPYQLDPELFQSKR